MEFCYWVIKMNRLSELINEKGLKKTWVAEQVGIAPGTLSKIISGETRAPELTKALKLARVLETTVEDLWGHLIEEK
jgi:DNA-binding XRE family transcriptional regulator